MTKGLAKVKEEQETRPNTTAEVESVIDFLEKVTIVKHSHDEEQVAGIIEQYKLVWEVIPTWMENSKRVSIKDFPLCWAGANTVCGSFLKGCSLGRTPL